ncbi:MAG: hypothetical protein RSN88_10885 [Gordonibacter sp.]|uniref:hypothetical protein n=1 Tax=Gordonibacter sp. TaxID=1968902 RepID=UPI002FC8CD63
MLNIQITESTPANMLRAIRAACNELLGETHADLTTQAAEHVTRANELQDAADAEAHRAAAARSAHNRTARYGHGGPIDVDKLCRVGEQPSEQEARAAIEDFREKHPEVTAAWQEANDVKRELAEMLPAENVDGPTIELDSASQPWSADLHASTKTKNADGTWKKRRGARDPRDVASDPAGTLIHEAGVPLVAAPIAPPVPPTPPAPAAEPIMPKIFALITSQIVTINQAVEAAQAEGYADLGANGLGGAPREAQEAVLRKLGG